MLFFKKYLERDKESCLIERYFLTIAILILATLNVFAEDCQKTPDQILAEMQSIANSTSRKWQTTNGFYDREFILDKESADYAKLKNSCARKISDSKLAKCFENMDRFIDQLEKVKSPHHANGFLLNDQEYKGSRSKANFELPKELMNGIPANYQEIAKANNWIFYEYSSSLVVGAGDSKRRLLFVVEEAPLAKWIQFTLPDQWPQNIGQEKMVDIISIDSSRSKAAPLVSYIEYSKEESANWESVNSKCLKCHANGLRPLRPARGSEGAHNTSYYELNAKISKYSGKYDIRPLLHNEDFGPAFGASQKCTSCHSNSLILKTNYGQIHGGYSKDALYSKMVRELQMPPGVLARSQYSDLSKALSQFSDLKADEKKGFRQIKSLSAPEVLQFMIDNKKISTALYEKAKDQLDQATAEAKANYEMLIENYKIELSEWLSGSDNKQCKIKGQVHAKPNRASH